MRARDWGLDSAFTLVVADVEALRAAPEQSRARYPDSEGFVERDGQRLFYEVYGEGEETIFLLPTWSLAHSRPLEDADPLPRASLSGAHDGRPW